MKIPANASVRTTLKIAAMNSTERRNAVAAKKANYQTPQRLNHFVGITESNRPTSVNFAHYGNVESSQSGIKF